MEALLTDVIESKIYTKENSLVTFQSPRAYIEPFLNIVGADRIVCKVQDAVTNMNIDGSHNTAFPRVAVEAHIGNEVTGYDSVVGMIFALNIQSPVIKLYTGQNAHACTNLTIFNAAAVSQYSLMNDYSDVYRKTEYYLRQKDAEIEQFLATKEKLLNEFYTEDELRNELGRLLLATTKKNSKIGYSAIAGAGRLIQESDSIYYMRPGEKMSKMMLYDSITQSITDSTDILHKPNKTIAVSQLLQIN
jgi:hypothetical protein